MLDRVVSVLAENGVSAEAYAEALYRFFAFGEEDFRDFFSLLAPDDFGYVYAALRASARKRVYRDFGRGKKADAAAVMLATGVYTPRWISDYMDKSALFDFLENADFSSFRVADLACGCGRLLLSAYRSLRRVYCQNGASLATSVRRILEQNLYGFDLDPHAILLTKCALFAEARLDDPLLLISEIRYNLFNLSDTSMDKNDDHESNIIEKYRQIKEYGSLYIPSAEETVRCGNEELSRIMRALSTPYDAILLNPPYMGKKNLSPTLAAFLAKVYPEGKTELYAAFLLRAISLLKPYGRLSFISIHSWMFLTSFEKLRLKILKETTLLSVLHLGAGTFPELQAYNALSAVLTLLNAPPPEGHTVSFRALTDISDPERKRSAFAATEEKRVAQADFLSYRGAPLLYQLPPEAFSVLRDAKRLGDLYPVRQGLATGDNARFVRFWFEPDPDAIAYGCATLSAARATGKRWFPYNKGGFYRKWYGMNEYVVDFYDGGKEILNFRDTKGKLRSRPQNMEYYFRSGITWSLFGFENFGVRKKEAGFVFDVSGSSLFAPDPDIPVILAYLASNVAFYFLSATAPTVNFQVGNIRDLPFIPPNPDDAATLSRLAEENVSLARLDWDEKEISFDFRRSPLLVLADGKTPLCDVYARYAAIREERKEKMRQNEETINRIFIRMFGLSGIVAPDVKERDLSLKSASAATEIEDLFSFYVGCCAGRYTLNGDRLYHNGARPVSELELIKGIPAFFSCLFGKDNFASDLAFAEEALGVSVSQYFKKRFYKRHRTRYQEHPIFYRIREGNTVLYIPVHRLSESIPRLSLYPLSDSYRRALTSVLSELSPDDGYEKDAPMLAPFT